MLDLNEASKKLYKFGSDLVGNRVFDLYLKYMGIKTLTSATLVPVALLLGKDAMENFLMDVEQTGGAILDDLPVLDDPLVGNYLKLAGLSTLEITTNTLVPLGVLMLVYDLYMNRENQQGGSLKKFVKRTYGNRVIDLFAKYQGLKTLTSATLVPFALILGRDALESLLKDDQQLGGALIPANLPLLDDPLLGNYLKIAGLSTLQLTPNTLVPLGVIAVLYNLYLDN
tara:strand:- start:4406 stop:5086 length:681 start_codon:yes stop_codon:yes gene_type:complete